MGLVIIIIKEIKLMKLNILEIFQKKDLKTFLNTSKGKEDDLRKEIKW